MTQEASHHKQDQQSEILGDILKSAQGAERQLQKLNRHKLITAYDSTSQLLLLQFMKGAAFGLGSVIGASLFVSLIIYLLSQVAFVPIIGEWIKVILAEIHK